MSDTLDLAAAGRREAAEDRRIAGLMREEKNRAILIRRAEVTDALVAEVQRLTAERDALRAAVTEVRALHRPVPGVTRAGNRTWCRECQLPPDFNDSQKWPCRTVAGLGPTEATT